MTKDLQAEIDLLKMRIEDLRKTKDNRSEKLNGKLEEVEFELYRQMNA